MNMWLQYFKLQLKRSAKITLKSLGVFALMGTVSIGLLWLISILFLQSGVLPKLSVALSIPESEELSRLAAGYITSTDSFSSLCEFEYTEKDEALRQLEAGQLQAVIVLPENFYHDVDIGLNPPVSLYLTDKKSISTTLFYNLVESGTAYLRIAESGVYAALDAGRVFVLKKENGSLGDAIALAYAKEIMGRELYFVKETLSPFGDFSVSEYYIGAGFLLLLIIFSFQFGFLYDRNGTAMEDKLRICGLRGVRLQFLRIAVETISLFAIGLILYFALLLLSVWQRSLVVFLSLDFLWRLLCVCLGISALTDGLFSIFRSGYAVFISMLLAALCGGVFFPPAFLPARIQQVGGILPHPYWFRLLAVGLFGGNGFDFFVAAIWIAVGMMMGAFAVWKD